MVRHESRHVFDNWNELRIVRCGVERSVGRRLYGEGRDRIKNISCILTQAGFASPQFREAIIARWQIVVFEGF